MNTKTYSTADYEVIGFVQNLLVYARVLVNDQALASSLVRNLLKENPRRNSARISRPFACELLRSLSCDAAGASALRPTAGDTGMPSPVAELSPSERQVLSLIKLFDMSHEEISEVTGMDLNEYALTVRDARENIARSISPQALN